MDCQHKVRSFSTLLNIQYEICNIEQNNACSAHSNMKSQSHLINMFKGHYLLECDAM